MSSKKQESKAARAIRFSLRKLNSDIARLQGEERELKQSLARELAEFKTGDMVYNDGVPSVVSHIGYKYGGVGYRVRRIRKNGQLYAGDNEVWTNDKLKARTSPKKYEETLPEFVERLKKEAREERADEQG